MAGIPTIKSVTCFLHCGDQFLFIHRTKKGNVTDAGRLNGIGGKLEQGEDFLSAALREVTEETGFTIGHDQTQLKAIVNMTGGYPEDWVMCFFSMTVPTLTVPKGMENDEGQLIWLPKNEVLASPYRLVSDLHYCWEHLANDDTRVLYAGCTVDETQEIATWSSRLV